MTEIRQNRPEIGQIGRQDIRTQYSEDRVLQEFFQKIKVSFETGINFN